MRAMETTSMPNRSGEECMEECARTMRAVECPPIRSMRKEEKGGSEEVIVPGVRVARENGSPPPNPLCFSVRPELVEGLTTNVFL
jgi:hypothetical protein